MPTMSSTNAPARKVVDRRVQPLQNRTVGFRPAQPLQQLVTDVAGFNVRKDQDVGLSGNFAARRLFGGYDRIQRRIGLHFAVNFDRQILIFRQFELFPGQPRGFGNFVHAFAFTRPLGRIGKQRHVRLNAELQSRLSGIHRNVRQLGRPSD